MRFARSQQSPPPDRAVAWCGLPPEDTAKKGQVAMHHCRNTDPAADQIPKDARGRFLLHDGTVFQGYLFDEERL